MNTSLEKQSSKDALLQSAEELFTEKGYAAVSTRELAEKAGVNLGAIQYHFGSKAQLFVETIRSLVSRQNGVNRFFSGAPQLHSEEEAAVEICLFIRAFVFDICHPNGPDVCRMMHREILGATSQNEELREVLISSIVEEFFRPFDNRLTSLIRTLAPEISESELHLIAQSIYGQCTYYPIDRAFLQRLRGMDYASKEHLTDVCRHISRFTLRGIGLKESEIEQALDTAAKNESEK